MYWKVDRCPGLKGRKGSKFRCHWKGQPDFVQRKTKPNCKQQWNPLPFQCQKSEANVDFHWFCPSEVETIIMHYITLSCPGNSRELGGSMKTRSQRPCQLIQRLTAISLNNQSALRKSCLIPQSRWSCVRGTEPLGKKVGGKGANQKSLVTSQCDLQEKVVRLYKSIHNYNSAHNQRLYERSHWFTPDYGSQCRWALILQRSVCSYDLICNIAEK